MELRKISFSWTPPKEESNDIFLENKLDNRIISLKKEKEESLNFLEKDCVINGFVDF